MNKKKVEKLLKDADICFLGYERSGCRDLLQMGLRRLHEAQEELSKPDWVSVEDRLPDMGTSVLVTNKEYSDEFYIDYRDYTDDNHNDKNGFLKSYGVTHWKPIEKLEE